MKTRSQIRRTNIQKGRPVNEGIEGTDCTKCRFFVICEAPRQWFVKVTGIKCNEFKEVVKDEVQSEQTEG